MNRFAISGALFALFSSVALPPFASAQDRAATNTVYQTEIVTNNAWARHVVSELVGEDADPVLMDKMGAFVSAANLAALGVATEDAHRVAEAWLRGFSDGTNELAKAMLNAPSNGILMKLCYPLVPSAARRSVDIFVVSNEYDSVRNRDCLWIYFSRELPMKPVMSVPYVWEGGFTTNRVAGQFHVADRPLSAWTNTVDIVRFGQTYESCHPCWFSRPADLSGTPIFMSRHGSFGSRPGGVEWGSIAVTVDGTPTFTGEVTNATEGVVAVFSNGGFLGTIQLEEQE